MREDICTIPISDVFSETDGCPICRMYSLLENRALDYIMGAAMMEPDVRISTNKKGFCGTHLRKMSERRGGLPFALMLETHIAELKEKVFKGADKDGKTSGEYMDSCFVCEKINWGMSRMVDTIFITYEKDRDFRQMFDNQPVFCLPHYNMLMSRIKKSALKKYSSEFKNSLKSITLNHIETLDEDLKHFCSMFDYRNNGSDDWGNSKTAIPRTVNFLSGEEAIFKTSKSEKK